VHALADRDRSPTDPLAPAALPGVVPRAAEVTLHRVLSRLNARRLLPTVTAPATVDLHFEQTARRAEEDFVARERETVAARLVDIPEQPEPFVRWFTGLKDSGPGQHDPLFPWLDQHASLDQVRWFLGQEVAGEAGFEDLLALTQLRMPVGPKLEMARNFWDELGRGGEAGMHGPMLERLADALSVRLPESQIVWPSLALANLMMALASNRHYAYQAVGALGVIELTAPDRARHVNAALRRLGVTPHVRQYFALHATLDVSHSAAWNRHVIGPLVAAVPPCARLIAEGALLRLNAGARCFAAYRRRFGLLPAADSPHR
jgi:hypothetical protein